MSSLQFKGKPFVQNHHLAVPYHELTPVKSRGLSKNVSLHDNLIVEGDNLLALKALLPTYHGKVKCIYIDPPYNTGNEGWAYNDNVNSPMMQAWLGKTVDREDLTRHDKWCCMMLPRLKLLRELLSEDGAIFVSIDDNEVHRLRCLMDEVFGEENFVANIIWQHSVQPKGYSGNISLSHNHILLYSRSETFEVGTLERTEEHNKHYANPDNDPRGKWRPGDVRNALYRPNLIYDLPTPSGKIIKPPDKGWRWSRETMEAKIESGEIIFSEDETKIIRKIYLDSVEGRAPDSIWHADEVGSTRRASSELKEIFGNPPLETAKPTLLIRKILQIATDKDSIILDSFAGSGTTAHAVLAQNKDDGGNRRFVLVECEDYVNKITAERIRRVVKGVPKARDEDLRKGLGGSFSYFRLGRPLEKHSLLEGDNLPDFETLAAYVFFTATGEEFRPKKIRKKSGFIGESLHYHVFLLYTPSIDKLRDLALDLKTARSLPSISGKRKLVFAPTRYLDDHWLGHFNIEFCQLPYQIYEAIGD